MVVTRGRFFYSILTGIKDYFYCVQSKTAKGSQKFLITLRCYITCTLLHRALLTSFLYKMKQPLTLNALDM